MNSDVLIQILGLHGKVLVFEKTHTKKSHDIKSNWYLYGNK